MRVGFRPPNLLSPRRRRAGRRAWLAALTMVVLAVTPLLAIFHQISAPHAVCEHGQLVESAENRLSFADMGRADVELATRDVPRSPAPGVRADMDSALHGHRHCSVGTLAKNSVALLPSAQIVTALSEGAIAASQHRAVAFVRTVLLSAPKTSPPHAAS